MTLQMLGGGNLRAWRRLTGAMFEAPASRTEDSDIARHDVSEDGVHWRPYDPQRDRGRTLHRRIEFAPSENERILER